MSALDARMTVQQKAALLLHLRRAGVHNLDVMRAIETVPRELFAPHKFRDLAQRDIALPIGCGQTMPSAADLARRLEALAPQPQHRVLEVGSGSGYATAALARLAREAVSFERFETLAIEAGRRLAALSIANALVLFGDGLAPSRALGSFERIMLHVAVEETPQALLDLLAPDGVMVFGRLLAAEPGDRRRAHLVRLARAGGAPQERDLGPCRLPPALTGLAAAI